MSIYILVLRSVVYDSVIKLLLNTVKIFSLFLLEMLNNACYLREPAAGGFIYALYHLVNKPNFNRVPQLSDGQIRGYIASNYRISLGANPNHVKHMEQLFE